MNDLNRVITALSSIGISIAAIETLLIQNPPGYTPSFYGLFPFWFWVVLIGSLIGSILLIARGGLSHSPHMVIRGVVLLAAGYAILYFLPQAIGFRFWSAVRADALMHFSYIDAILTTGHNPTRNMYPGTHLIVAQTASVSGLRIEVFQPLLMYIVSGTFVSGCVLLGRRLFGWKGSIFTLVAGSPLVYGKYMHHLMPWFVGFALLPLGLLIIEMVRDEGCSRKSLIATLSVLMFGMVFIHPMTTVVFIVALSAGILAIALHNSITHEDIRNYRPNWIFLVTVPLLVWYLSKDSFSSLIRVVTISVLESDPGAVRKAQEAGESGYTTIQIIWEFLVLDYGVLLCYLAGGGLVVLWIGYRYLSGKYPNEVFGIGAIWYTAGGFLGLGFLAVNAVVGQFYRLNQLTLFAAIILLGGGLAALLSNKKDTRGRSASLVKLAIALCIGVILIATVLSSVGVYDEKRHIVETEFAGVDHHLEYRNPSVHTKSMKISHVTQMYVLGYHNHQEIPYQQWAFRYDNPRYELPSDLYATEDSLAGHYDGDGYAIILERNQRWYTLEPSNRWDTVSYISDNELSRLNTDQTAYRVYDNGGAITWFANNNSED